MEPLVLVVEDEVLVRMAVSEDLRQHGFRVVETRDADEAVDVIRSRSDIDVVFTDVVMPGRMSGADLALTWLRKYKPELPILLTSGVAHGLPSLEGAQHIVPKPYDIDTLVNTLRELIAYRSRH